MSRYTTQVRYICESAVGLSESVGFDDTLRVIEEAEPIVFENINYPIFDESYRHCLNRKILQHFYTREIGYETVGLWKLKLKTRLDEIMPYYNLLYKSTTLEFNPLYDFHKTTTQIRSTDSSGKAESTSLSEGESKTDKNDTSVGETSAKTDNTANTTSSTTGNTTANGSDLYSDTPQGALTGVEAGTYLTNARKTANTQNDSTSSNGNSTSATDYTSTDTNAAQQKMTSADSRSALNASTNSASSVEEFTETVIGKQGSASYAQMILDYRKTLLNIDKEIISDLDTLFMGLWE